MASCDIASRSNSSGQSAGSILSPLSSFDLIDFSSPASADFDHAAINLPERTVSFESIEEDSIEAVSVEGEHEEEVVITEHHGVSQLCSLENDSANSPDVLVQ